MDGAIKAGFSEEEFPEFLSWAANTKGLKLKDIQAKAAEYGLEVSLMAARTFKKGPFAAYLAELKQKREMAEDISAVAKNGLGLADASATMLSQKIFDRLHNAETLSDDETDQLSLSLSRIRTGDQRSKFLEAKLDEMRQKLEMQQFDAVQAAITHAKEIRTVMGDKSLDDSARTERVRQLLFGAAPEGFTPVATTGDAR